MNVRIRECAKVVIIHFCSNCENISAFCEIEVWKNGCNFAASNETNKNRIINNKTNTYARNYIVKRSEYALAGLRSLSSVAR